jgi:hypothetical protein
MNTKLVKIGGLVLLAIGAVTLALSIVLFGSFSIYLTALVQTLAPAIAVASSALYLIAYMGLVAGLGMAIAGILLLLASRSG